MYQLDSLLGDWGATPVLRYENNDVGAADIRRSAAHVAAGLRSLGIGKGDRVAIWLPNCPAWLEVLFGCAQIGAIAVAVNTRFRSAEVQDIVGRSGARALFMWPGFKGIDFLSILEDVDARELTGLEWVVALEETPAWEGAQPVYSYEEFTSHGAEAGYGAAGEDGCAIFTTSGTTKAPKFVLHTHRSTVHHAQDVVRAFAYDEPGACFMLGVPLCGVFGYAQMMATLAAKRPTVMMPTFSGPEAASLVKRHGVTHLNATDDMLELMLADEVDQKPFPSLRRCGFASFNRDPKETMAMGEARGLPLVGLYGMSEVQALFAGQSPGDPPEQRALGGGVPVASDAKVRVCDPDTGERLPLGEPGELELRGPSLMAGYFGNPDATADAITEDGFIRTGDLGYQTETGFVFLTRMGDAMRLGGFLVNPAEISSQIEDMEAVVQAQVVAISHGGKSRPFAFVLLEEGVSLDEAAILAHCRERLAGFKVPLGVRALDRFPVAESANGTKIQRNRLRQLAEKAVA